MCRVGAVERQMAAVEKKNIVRGHCCKQTQIHTENGLPENGIRYPGNLRPGFRVNRNELGSGVAFGNSFPEKLRTVSTSDFNDRGRPVGTHETICHPRIVSRKMHVI